MNRAGAQDDLAALDARPSVAHAHAHRYRAVACKLDAIDQRVADDSQVRASARRFEVAIVGRHASVGAAVHRIGRYSRA